MQSHGGELAHSPQRNHTKGAFYTGNQSRWAFLRSPGCSASNLDLMQVGIFFFFSLFFPHFSGGWRRVERTFPRGQGYRSSHEGKATQPPETHTHTHCCPLANQTSSLLRLGNSPPPPTHPHQSPLGRGVNFY